MATLSRLEVCGSLSDKFYVGLDLTGFQDNGKRRPIDSVTLQVDNATVVTAGAYGGHDLYALCPYATQDMVTAILLQVHGYEYQAYTADSANIDPAAELGDGVDVGGIYSVISAIQDDGDGYMSLSAPGEEELEDEYPYRNTTDRELSGDIDSIRAFVQAYTAVLQQELNSMKTEMQAMTQTLQDISSKVTELDSRVKALGG
ncbi:MAG: KID repeat-containing protein [Caudoviricetes sp.]|nr:MAG: KID repeat-containing protein [Caudoviricetes sp.]